MGQLDGKIAIVTGASRGMGASHARRFVAEGAQVLLTDMRADVGDALRRLAEEDLHQLPVVEDGRLVGMLTRADILRFLQVREDLGMQDVPAQPPRQRIAA